MIDIGKVENVPSSSVDLASSPLWHEEIRTHCSEHKLATYQINLLRSKSISDQDLQLNEEESQIPLIFIHHDDLLSPLSTRRSDFGSGWDVILPNEWAQIFWISLVFSGARPIGQKELSFIAHETGKNQFFFSYEKRNNRFSGEFQFPQEYPDTDAGMAWKTKIHSEQLTHFSKCPPSKRPNFFLYGINSPFCSLWSVIVRDWALEYNPSNTVIPASRYYVLRDRRVRSLDALRQHLYSLVPVRIIIKGKKGVIDNTTLIYLPNKDDLKNPKKEILETRHSDRARQEERKMQKAKQAYQRGQTMIKLIEERVADSDKPLIHDCERKLLGAISSGAFQLSQACCTGKGFIATGGLITLLQQQEQKNAKQQLRKVLVRTTSSQYYRWGLLEF